MKTLFVNGDSFLANKHGGVDMPFTVAELLHKSYFNDYSLVKLARGGSGNDSTFLTTVNWFERHPKLKKDAHVLICWTESQRVDYPTKIDYNPQQPEQFIHHHKPMDQSWSTFPLSSYVGHPFSVVVNSIMKKFNLLDPGYPDWVVTKWYQNVLGLQNYLKANNIQYTFYNSLPPSCDEGKKDHGYWLKAIDKSNFYRVHYSQYEFCQDNKLVISNTNHHPTEQGHIEWANKLIRFIKR